MLLSQTAKQPPPLHTQSASAAPRPADLCQRRPRVDQAAKGAGGDPGQFEGGNGLAHASIQLGAEALAGPSFFHARSSQAQLAVMPSIQASRDIARSNPSPGHARQLPLIDDMLRRLERTGGPMVVQCSA